MSVDQAWVDVGAYVRRQREVDAAVREGILRASGGPTAAWLVVNVMADWARADTMWAGAWRTTISQIRQAWREAHS